MKSPSARDKAHLIADAALEKKAGDVIILEMQDVSTFCDYFVIASAGSFKKTKAIADHIEESLIKRRIRPHHIEGREDSSWILMDYGEVVAHLFYEQARGFYGLERLWGDAKRRELSA